MKLAATLITIDANASLLLIQKTTKIIRNAIAKQPTAIMIELEFWPGIKTTYTPAASRQATEKIINKQMNNFAVHLISNIKVTAIRIASGKESKIRVQLSTRADMPLAEPPKAAAIQFFTLSEVGKHAVLAALS